MQISRDQASENWRRDLLLLIAGAILVRAVVFALRGDHLDWDEGLYLLMARNIADGAGIVLNGYPHTALGPFVPLATVALAALPGIELHVAHRLLVVVLGALLLVPVYYLIRLSAGRRLAFLAALLLVGWPALIDVAPKLGPMWRHLYAGTEPIFLTLLFGSLALGEMGLRREKRGRTLLLLGAGVVLGCAYLSRPEAVVFAGLYAVFRVTPWLRERSAPPVLGGLAIAGLGALLVVAPYLYHTRQVTGSWTPSGKLAPTRISGDLYQSLVLHDRHMGAYLRTWWALEPGHRYLLNPYWGADPDVPDQRRLAAFRARLASEWDPEESGSPLRRVWAYVLALWKLSGPLLLPLALLGLFAGRSQLPRLWPPFTVAGLASSVLTLVAVFALPRFFLYLVPAFALWSARGIVALGDLAARYRLPVRERTLGIAVMLVSFLMGAAGTLSEEAGDLRQFATENRLAASRLGAEAISEGRPVMAWHPRLAYWGGFSWRALPVAALDATVHYALARGTLDLFLVRGMYTPLQLTTPYVLIRIDPQLSPEFLRGADAAGDERLHSHPPTQLVPVEPVAGFPTGIVRLDPAEAGDGS